VDNAPLTAAIDEVRAGAAGRGPLPITVSGYCRITDDVARDARELKPICLGLAFNGGAPFLAKTGLDIRLPDRLPAAYPDLLHAQDWAAAVRACEPYVTDRAAEIFARKFCLFGTAEEIVNRLREVRKAGADAVFLQHVGSYDLPRELLTDVATRVLPALRDDPSTVD
jgi:5,10-methylenetetrahydromethanopterin reductase